MKALIVFDSVYGNTEKIARAVGDALTGDIKVMKAEEVDSPALDSLDILIIGAPTYGGRPTPVMKEFLSRLSKNTVKNHYVAAFDTRFSTKWVGIFGFAAGKIARSLKTMGGILIVPPEGFIVMGTEGPLRDGELERAAYWAKGIIERLNHKS